MLHRIRFLIGRMLRPKSAEAELSKEVESCLQILIQQHRNAGHSEKEARRKALLDLGGAEQIKESVREKRSGRWLLDLVRDSRFALRIYRRSPLFAAAAVLTLALGIGANTLIFSLVSGILWKPLPYENPDRIVSVYVWPGPWFSKAAFEQFRTEAVSYQSLSALSFESLSVAVRGNAEQVDGAAVTADYFRTLGAEAALGRTFAPGEDLPGGDGVVLLSHRYWQSRFGGRPEAIGERIRIAGKERTIIGILRAGFEFHWVPDASVAIPNVLDPNGPDFSWMRNRVIGRLKPGVNRAEAAQELESILEDWQRRFDIPSQFLREPDVRLLRSELARDLGPKLYLLFGSVAFILLIAAANVSNLFLGKAITRTREIALRASLGGSTSRILRQLLTESATLAAAGGGLGLAVSALGLDALIRVLPAHTPRLSQLSIDWRVAAFAALLTVGVGLAAGCAPALRVGRLEVGGRLLSRGQGGSLPKGRSMLQAGLVATQVGLALVLVLGAGLFLKSLWRMTQVDPGFRTAGLIAFDVAPDPRRFESPQHMRTFFQGLLERFRGLPSVSSAASADILPARGDSMDSYRLEGRPDDADPLSAQVRIVSQGYFRAAGQRLLSGRVFSSEDNAQSSPVAVVSQAMATEAWPGESPLGKRFVQDGHLTTVVGVAADAAVWGLQHEKPPTIYKPFDQGFRLLFEQNRRRLSFIVRSNGRIGDLAEGLRAVVQDADPLAPVGDIRPIADDLSAQMSEPRLIAALLLIFAAAAASLGAVGIYGVMSATVDSRQAELSLRVALGASAAKMLRGVLLESSKAVGLGMLLGLVLYAALARTIESHLFQVHPLDFATLCLTVAALALTALAAALTPAIRAARADPMQVLRSQ